MNITLDAVLLLTLFVGFLIFMVIDAALIKSIKIRVKENKIVIRKPFKYKKLFSFKDLNSWMKIDGHNRYTGSGYILIIRFNNKESYQIDSSYAPKQCEQLYRELNTKYKYLYEK